MKFATVWGSRRPEPRHTITSQCDGQTERQNRTIPGMLSPFLVSGQRDDWDSWLDSMTLAYNTSKQESLGVSPYEVVFGRTPRLPIELDLGITLSNPSTQSGYLHSIKSVFRDIREIAKENLAKEAEKRARLDQGTNTWQPFNEGQAVMLKRPKVWKFGTKWRGPYEITKRLGVNYKIRHKGGKEIVVHHNNLKISYIRFNQGELVCPTVETGEFQEVENAHQPQVIPRARPARLRQTIRPPDRYGF